MTHDRLRRASEELHAAAEAADGEQRNRLTDQAEALAGLAESGTDHGRLARHENVLREIKTATDETVGEHVDAAMASITAYRETLDGV